MNFANGHFRVLLAFLLIFSGLCFLISCSSPEKSILGKWRNSNNKETVDFFEDGTANFSGEKGTMVGKYRFVDKEHLLIDIGMYGTNIFSFTITNKELHLNGEDGKNLVYYRVTKKEIEEEKERARIKVAQEQERIRLETERKKLAEEAKKHADLGNMFLKQQNWKDSVEEYSKAINIDDSNGESFAKRGYCYRMMKKYDSAINDFQKSLDTQYNRNGKANSLYNMGYIFSNQTYDKQNFDKAKKYFIQSCDLGNKEACTILDVGKIKIKVDNPAKNETKSFNVILSTVYEIWQGDSFEVSGCASNLKLNNTKDVGPGCQIVLHPQNNEEPDIQFWLLDKFPDLDKNRRGTTIFTILGREPF